MRKGATVNSKTKGERKTEEKHKTARSENSNENSIQQADLSHSPNSPI